MDINSHQQDQAQNGASLGAQVAMLTQRVAELATENQALRTQISQFDGGLNAAHTSSNPPGVADSQRELHRLRQVLRHSNSAFVILRGPNHLIELANQAYQKVVGRSKSIEGLTIMQALPEIQNQGFEQLLDEVYRTGQPYIAREMPALLDRKGNGELEKALFNFMYYPLTDVEGVIEGIFIEATDVTDEVRVRQALEQQRQRLEEVFTNAPAAIATLRGPDYIFELTNEPYMRLVGRRNSIIGQRVLEAIPEVAGQGFMELLDNVYQTGQPFIGQEMPIQFDANGDGKLEQAFVNFVYQPLFAPSTDGSHKVEGIFAHVVDVTEQVQARQKIEELSQLKDEFLAIASHDLRTPVTSIKGYLQLLQRSLLKQQHLLERPSDNSVNEGDHEDRSYGTASRFVENSLQLVTTVLNQTNRLIELLDRLLDFSRISEGQLKLHYTPNADLTKLVAEVVTSLAITTKKHHIVVHNPTTQPIRLSYDETRLEQVLNNLITNAIKYSPTGTTITVGIEPSRPVQNEVVIWVQDEGYGVDSAQQTHLFERFYRVQNEQNASKGGLGLGLYISAEIVKQHHGRMWVESQVGQGSTFYVALPTELNREKLYE